MRSVDAKGCDAVSTLDFRADGPFHAERSYQASATRCSVATPYDLIQGTCTVNSTNIVTFRVAETRGSFALRYASRVFSQVSGSRTYAAALRASFRTLAAGRCVRAPVCGENGVTCSNPCHASAAGVNVASPGECGPMPPPPNTFCAPGICASLRGQWHHVPACLLRRSGTPREHCTSRSLRTDEQSGSSPIATFDKGPDGPLCAV